MSTPSSSLIHYIYKMAGAYRNDQRSDAELLSRYAEAQDEHAFGALMVRHGPMVWGMCRRILTNTQDVEEAYQTVFLALAQKAYKIHVTESLVGWLQKVTHRTALNARRDAQSRQRRQQGLKTLAPTEKAPHAAATTDVYEELHGEIAKLPEKLRVALILHYLEGKTQAEVAKLLGIEESALWHRLDRGKAILEKRLRQTGLAGGAAAIGMLLTESASNAAVPLGLAAKTLKTAAAFRDGQLTGGLVELAREVLKQTPSFTPWWKTGWMITVVCVASLGAGLGGVAWKTGFFGTKAEAPAISSQPNSGPRLEKDGPIQPRLDRYGDPLPPGALVRLGTTRFRDSRMCVPLFTRDGKGLIMRGMDKALRLCDVATGRVIRKFGNNIGAFALSRDGRVLAARNLGVYGGLHLWDVATAKVLQQIDVGKMDWDAALVFSPDDRKIATAGHQSKQGVWDVATGRTLWATSSREGWRSLAFSHDGKKLLEFNSSGLHHVDALSGKEVYHKDNRYMKNMRCLDWSLDGRLAVQAGGGVAYLWDANTGEQIREFAEPTTSDISSAALASNAKLLATGNSEGWVRFWDVDTGKELRRVQGSLGPIRCLKFSPNGEVLAVGSQWRDETIHLWNVKTCVEITPSFAGHRSRVASILFTPNGKEIVSTGRDCSFRLWTVETGDMQEERMRSPDFGPQLPVNCGDAQVSPDGRSLAFSEICQKRRASIVTILHRENLGRQKTTDISLELPPRLQFNFAFSPDSKILACPGGHNNTRSLLLDATTGKVLDCDLGHCRRIAFSSDGSTVATEQTDASGKQTGAIVVWDFTTKRELCSFAAGKDDKREGLHGLALSADGRVIAAVVDTGRIRLWRLHSYLKEERLRADFWQEIDSPIDVSRQDVPLLFSPDGWMLAAVDVNNAIHLWETITGAKRISFGGHEDAIASLAFSPDSRRLASGSSDTTILIWDVTGRLNNGESRRLVPSQRAMESQWADMASDDVARAGGAVWNLALSGDPAVAFLRKRLQPVKSASLSQKQVDQLILDLWSDDFRIHMGAYDSLAKLGEQAGPTLRKALSDKPSKTLRRRLETLLGLLEEHKKKPSTEVVRQFRAIEALERIATPSAENLLQYLAAGMTEACQTQAAQSAVARLRGLKGRQCD